MYVVMILKANNPNSMIYCIVKIIFNFIIMFISLIFENYILNKKKKLLSLLEYEIFQRKLLNIFY